MTEFEQPRRLNVDMSELEMAFDFSSPESSCFLDKQTGHVVLVMNETSRQLEEIYESLGEASESTSLTEALKEFDEDEREALLEADGVEREYGDRYVRIPEQDSREAYRDMEDFIETVEDGHLADLLAVAIRGPGAFRRFKDVLYGYSEERALWFAFQKQRAHDRTVEWLESEGIRRIVD